jgi:dephospho-CoA kinase
MFILGLTGSIGMGKSTTAAMFRDEGAEVYDSDAAVHSAYSGEAVPLIEAAFPGTVEGGIVDRTRLGRRVLNDPAALARLESIVHPLVDARRKAFLARAKEKCAALVVLDIPLLFETGLDREVDAVVLVSAPEVVQKERLRRREGMTEERFAGIMARQMPDAEKRARAHFIIDTSGDFAATRRQVRAVLRALAGTKNKL